LIQAGDNVLEIGCGTGSLTLEAKAQAGREENLDTSTPTQPWLKKIMGQMASHSLSELEPLLQANCFEDIKVGPTRFRMLAFISGVKTVSTHLSG